MAKAPEKVFIEILIRIEGSDVLNRITTFELPITYRVEAKDMDNPGSVEFESKTLIKRMRAALRKVI